MSSVDFSLPFRRPPACYRTDAIGSVRPVGFNPINFWVIQAQIQKRWGRYYRPIGVRS
jgi:hypothetical protein